MCNHPYNRDMGIPSTPQSPSPLTVSPLPCTPPSPRQPLVCFQSCRCTLSRLPCQFNYTFCAWPLSLSTVPPRLPTSPIGGVLFPCHIIFPCAAMLPCGFPVTSQWTWRLLSSSTQKCATSQPAHLGRESRRLIDQGRREQVFFRTVRPDCLS